MLDFSVSEAKLGDTFLWIRGGFEFDRYDGKGRGIKSGSGVTLSAKLAKFLAVVAIVVEFLFTGDGGRFDTVCGTNPSYKILLHFFEEGAFVFSPYFLFCHLEHFFPLSLAIILVTEES